MFLVYTDGEELQDGETSNTTSTKKKKKKKKKSAGAKTTEGEGQSNKKNYLSLTSYSKLLRFKGRKLTPKLPKSTVNSPLKLLQILSLISYENLVLHQDDFYLIS